MSYQLIDMHRKLTAKPLLAALTVLGLWSSQAHSGSFVVGDQIPDARTFPAGYTGGGGTLEVNVCIVPGSSNAIDMERSIKNNIAHWNKLQATSSNLRDIVLPSNTFDFESVALHEIGHCIGLGHPNLGFREGVVTGTNTNFTDSTAGADSAFAFNAGADGTIGSADDVRADDVNLFYFNPSNNNPFSLAKTVDATNYTRDIAALPAGDLFPANPDRAVAAQARYKAPFTEATMQQGTNNAEIQRTLGHDDVATLRFGMSGLDASEGTADDYTVHLNYQGITAADCDINMSMDAEQTGFAVCFWGGFFTGIEGGDITLDSTDIFFNPNIDWFFTQSAPCNETQALVAGEWKMISLPCEVGISTPATLAAVIGDDLSGVIDVDWAVFDYTHTEQADGSFVGAYRRLALNDELQNGRGYWILTNIAGESISIVGEYNSQVDSPLAVQSGTPLGWNMVGMPFRFPAAWADVNVVDDNGSLLSLNEADPGPLGSSACSGATPAANCTVSKTAFIWDAALEDYARLTPAAGILEKFDGVWVVTAKPDVAIRIPMSVAARTTP